MKKISGQMRRLTARKWIHPSKNNKVFTSLGFSRRCWTIVRRNSSWDIWIPLMRSSCSESAKNMQFPSPWLSEIAKPFSKAVLFNVCDSLVLQDSMRASSRICWSATKMGSPVKGRWKRQNKIEVISRQFNRRWSSILCWKISPVGAFPCLWRHPLFYPRDKNAFLHIN